MSAKLTKGEIMMLNFMFQIDWAKECPDISLNISVFVQEGVS